MPTISTGYRSPELVHDSIAKVARCAPTVTAIRFASRTITYGRLDELATQLAQYLIRQGVQPRDTVGIALPRSPDFVVALLSILKAGCAYLPLDVAYPPDRLRSFIESAGVSTVLTTATVNRLPAKSRALLIEDAESESGPRSTPYPMPRITAADLAYVMFTSGSSGPPKGVRIAHTSVASYVRAMKELTALTPADTYLHMAPFAFSASVRQLMVPLCAGATVCLATDRERTNPVALMALIVRERVTVLDVFPSYLRRIARALDSTRTDAATAPIEQTALRLILTTSEPLSYTIPHYWRGQSRRALRFINMYGQTETCGVNTAYEVPEGSPRSDATVPVGRAFGHGTVRILNADRGEAATGEIGELYVSGDCVGRGYVNDSVRTGQTFVVDQTGADGSVMYRTGDVGKRLADGNLLLVGRRDRVVKLRGNRIALDEVEAVLRQHPSVDEARVRVRDADTGSAQLVGYVTSPRSGMNGNALRADFVKMMPAHMAPSVVVVLHSFPTFPNGKVDDDALPPLAKFPRHTASPTSTRESDLLKLWMAVLQRNDLGVEDDFFESGGDSLLAASLFCEIESLIGRTLPLSTLLDAPTVRTMAAVLDAPPTAPWPCLVTIRAGGERSPLFLVHARGGNVVGYRTLSLHLSLDRPIYGLQALGLDGRTPPLRSIEAMASHYIAAVRSVQPAGPYLLGGHSFGGWVALEMAHQLTTVGEEVSLLALFDPHKTFDSRAALRDLSPATLMIRRAMFHRRQFLRAEDKLAYLTARARTVGRRLRTRIVGRHLPAIDEGAGPAEALRAVSHADWLALRDYVPRRVGRITLFASREGSPFFKSPYEEWGQHADELRVHYVEGTHTSILTEPYVRGLANTLNLLLKEG